MAEGEGFEPSIRSPAYTLSKRAPSATRPPLHRVFLDRKNKSPRRRKLTEARSLRNGYYAAMRLFLYIGLVFLGLGFLAAAAEIALHALPGIQRSFVVPAYDLWYALSPETMLITEIRVQRLFGDWLWDLVILTILKFPAWLIVGGPGAALVFFGANRRPQSREEIEQVNESYALYYELTKRALEENPPGEEHGPHDILPENPIEDDQIIDSTFFKSEGRDENSQ